ncbi:hypothetical protein T069G_01918 [Trichoderma breve]|uniref:Fungal-type protein kinase domain-containing protein n=1 Tax=Trichoderma breve TaxID=2034170 RepID=A0A9W9EEL3_9HYPO|nr:hypothetical protein T069G_01918 [Trichoderma breve]KAJ4865388.1 hypothetical protein T069G_01918 [Trichoderma breve]
MPSVTITRSTSGILNSSKLPREVDQVPKEESGLGVDIRKLRQSFFTSVLLLEEAASAVLRKYSEGEKPLFCQEGCNIDVGSVNDDVVYRPYAGKLGRYRWSHVLVPGELKCTTMADAPPVAWIDLAGHAREVLSAQGTGRFVLAFSLYGSLVGEERLGFGLTIRTSHGKRFIEIERNSRPERLIIDEVIARSRCIAGRATTCWKAYIGGDPQTVFAIKGSWQYSERNDKGEILREVAQQGVTNVARYNYHKTVRLCDAEDEIRNSVCTGLDITTAVAPPATTDAVTTPDSTATTVMANAPAAGDAVATATADPTAITAVVGKASANDTVAPTTTTTTIARRTPASSISTSSTIAVAAPRRKRPTAQQGKKKTPRVQQLCQSERLRTANLQG